MAQLFALVHHAYMVTHGNRHFLRQWRESQDRSLESVAEAVVLLSQERAHTGEGRPLRMTHATLSRIERGKLPYNQHLLEMLAEIYGTDVASLIIRDPSKPEAPWTVFEGLTPAQQRQAVELIKTLVRTGTEG
jgi:transcriptional regulator with XRE-family HTH domain